MSRSSRNRFRPFSQFLSSGSRAARQATKALLRANRNDAQWMARFRKRQNRIARWKAAFGRFVPLNITRFRAVMGVFMGVVASLFTGQTLRTRPAFVNRSGMINLGSKRKNKKNRKSTRVKSKGADSHSYSVLEPRQLLAADIMSIAGDNVINFSEQTDVTIVGTADEGANVRITLADVVDITVTAVGDGSNTGTGIFTTAGLDIDVSSLPDGNTPNFIANQLDSLGNPDGSESSSVGAFKDTSADADATPLSVTINDEDGFINGSEVSSVDFTVNGVDMDANDDPVAFTDGTNTVFALVGSPVDLSTLNDGPITATVSVEDSAGNVTAATDTSTLDTIANVSSVTIEDGGDGFVNADEAEDAVSFTVVADEPNATTVGVVSSSPLNASGDSLDLSATDDGTVTVMVTVTDQAGNSATVSDTTVLDTTADGDATPLSITVDDGDGFVDASEVGAVPFTVAGLDADSAATVTFSDSTTVLDEILVTTNGPQTPVDLSSLSGPITATIVATDAASNTANASDSSEIDSALPSVAVTLAAGQTASTFDLPVVFNVAFSEGVTGLDPADLVIGGTAVFTSAPTATITSGVSGDSEYEVTVSGIVSTAGTVTLSVPAGIAFDTATNNNLASPEAAEVTLSARAISIESNDSLPRENQGNNAQFTVSLDDGSPVSGGATEVIFRINSNSTAELGLDPQDFIFGPQVTDNGDETFSVTIDGNGSAQVIDIDLQDDLNFDPDETVILDLVGFNNDDNDLFVVGSQGSDLITIDDDEVGPTVSVAANDSTAAEGDPTTTSSGQFTISLSTPVDSDTTVVLNITQASNSSDANDAINGTDYTFSSDIVDTDGSVIGSNLLGSTATTVTVLIPAFASSVTLDVNPIAEEVLVELTEQVRLTPASTTQVSGTGPINVSNISAVVNISDDDTGTVSIDSTVTTTEGGTEPEGTLTFTLTDPASTDTTVSFNQTGTAAYGADYWLDVPVVEVEENNGRTTTAQDIDGAAFNLSANVNIANSTTIPHVTILGLGDNSSDFYQFTVPQGADIRLESDSVVGFGGNVQLRLGSGNNSNVQTSSNGLLIRNNVTAGTYTVRVRDLAAGNVPLGASYQLHVSVEGHATPTPTAVTIPAGETTLDIPISIVNDAILENDEAVTFTIPAGIVAGIDTDISADPRAANRTTTTNVIDNELATVSIDNGLNAIEDDVSINGTFTISSNRQSDIPITVPFVVTEPSVIGQGDSEFGIDYTFSSNVTVGTGANAGLFFVTLPANTSNPQVTIQVIPINEAVVLDTDVEQNETIRLTLVDNAFDATPTNRDDSLQYDATADGDSDVVIGTASDAIIIQDTDLAVVTVNSTIDTAVEGGADGEFEIVLVSRDLSLPLDNGPATPLLPIESNTVVASSDTVVTYEIVFTDPTPPSTGPQGQPATPADIDTTSDATPATGVVIAGGTITIPAGQDRVFLPLSAIDDGMSEGTEEVFLRILEVTSGDSDIEIADPSTNADDDVIFIQDAQSNTVKISVDPNSVDEEAGTVAFTVELTGADLVEAAQAPITVNYSVSGSATSTLDFEALSGSVVIPAGANPSATISVNVLEDTIIELDETITITIDSIEYAGPAAITIDEMDSDTLTITEDDMAEVVIDATDQFAGEGQDDGLFTVSLRDSETGLPVTSSTGVLVNYSTIFPTNPSPNTPHATEGVDYSNLLGSINIAPNQSSASFSVNVIDDANLEGTERVVVQLDDTGSPTLFTVSAPSGPTDGTGGGLIGNRDYVLIAADQEVSVGSFRDATEGGATGAFEVSINRTSTTDTFVTYTLSTVADTTTDAEEGIDFATTTGTVTIPANQLSALVIVDATTVGDDFVIEGTEEVSITLTGVTNTAPNVGADITIGASDEATLAIFDDDAGFVTVAGTTNAIEGTIDGQFTVTLRDRVGSPTTSSTDTEVTYFVTGTATNGLDYQSLPLTVTIPAGLPTEVIDINVSDIFDDGITEGIETVTVTLVETVEPPTDPDISIGAIGGPEVTFQQGVNGYTGTEDIFVDQDSPATNNDGDGIFSNTDTFFGGPASSEAQHGALRFDGLFDPNAVFVGSTIGSAELSLFVPPSVLGVAGGDINLHFLNTQFSESLDWLSSASVGNFIPGIQPDGLDASIASNLTGFNFQSYTLSGNGLAIGGVNENILDVTQFVQQWSDGRANDGFAILPGDTANGTNFLDSEFGVVAFRPQLTVTIDPSATITITDNDETTIDITGNTAGQEQASPAAPINGVVEVTLSTPLPPEHTVTVSYSVEASSSSNAATPNSDFTPVIGSFNIAAGDTIGTFEVPVLEDFLNEGTENVLVRITGFNVSGPNAEAVAANVSLGTTTDLVDIIDNDTTEVTVAVLTSGTESPGTGSGAHSDTVFQVSIDRTSTAPTEVSYTLSSTDSDFVFGSDIAPTTTTGTVTIPAGAEFVNFTVNVLDDLINEDNESFTFTLDSIVSSNSGITIGTGTDRFATDTIEDDDDLEALVDTSADPTADESRFPSTSDNTGTFTISLNFASDRSTTVPFRVTVPFSNAAALPSGFNTAGNPEGADYELIAGAGITWVTPTTGFATFGPSASPQSTTITLVATQDFDPTEVNEFARIAIVDTISAPGPDPALFNPNRPADFLDPFNSGGFRPDNVDGAGNFAAVEIIDEDFVVSLDPTDSPALEDGPPISGFDGQFTVLISNPTQVGNTVTVPFTVADDVDQTSTNTATYGEDYVFTSGTLGSVVTVDPDSIGTGTITGTVTIPGGQTQALITIEVLADNVVEGEFSTAAGAGLEDIALTLGTPVVSSGDIATLDSDAALGIQRIIDNDEADVNVSVVDDLGGLDSPGIGEDDNDGGFEFTLDKAAQGRDVRIDFVVRGTSTATDGSDFVFGPNVQGSGTAADPYHVIIPAGDTSVTAVIDVLSDVEAEGSESVNIQITEVIEYFAGTMDLASTDAIDGGTTLLASAIIQDDDRPTVSVFAIDADASEPTNPGIFEFTLSQPSASPVTVTYTVGGDANQGTIGDQDYVPLSGSVTFEAGETSVEVVVETLDDDVVENDETVIVTLDEETSSPLVTAVGEATVIIASEDVATATLSVAPGDDASETDATGSGQGQFTVTLDRVADEDVTISLDDVTDSGLGLALPDDFTTAASVTILAGELTGTVSVTPIDDVIAEGPEELSFVLGEVTAPDPYESSLVGDLILLDDGSATMTIEDNDVPIFTVTDFSAEEGLVSTTDDGTGISTYTFTVSHNAASLAEDVTITPTLFGNGVGGTLTTAGPQNYGQDDFAFTDGTVPVLTFVDGGPTSQTFTVDVFHDIVQEADESFTVSLDATTVGPLIVDASDTGTGTILNDDFVQYTIVQDGLAVEGSVTPGSPYIEGTAFSTLSFVITPSIPVDVDIPVAVDYDNGEGNNGAVGADFAAIFRPNGTQTLSFGTDFDNGTDNVTFLTSNSDAFIAATPLTVNVAVVQDVIVEGALGTNLGFGTENFTTNLSSVNTTRPGISFNDSTGTIADDDGQVVSVPGLEIIPANDVPAVVSVSASDPLNNPDSIAIGALDASEPGAPFGDGEFTFSVSTPVQEDIVISYSFTVDGALGDPNGDLGADTTDDNPDNPLGDPSTGNGTITIPGSSTTPITSVTLPFSVFDDLILEDDEDVVITITGIETDRNVDFSTESAAVTIQDDDRALISIATLDGVATEGSTTDTATFRISISQVSDTPTTVGLALRSSTGSGLLSDVDLTSTDYSIAGLVDGTLLPNSVTIPANTPFVDIVVTGLQDTLTEDPENLAVELIDDGTLGIFGNGDADIDTDNDQAVITINDDGDGFTVNAEFVRDGNEPGTGTTDDGIFRIQLRDGFGDSAIVPFGSTSGGGLLITYTIAGTNLIPAGQPGEGTIDPLLDAAEPNDFTTNAFTVVIAEGQSFADVNINVADDLEVENPETVELTITSINTTDGAITTLAGETIATGQASGRLNINDNDGGDSTVPVILGDANENGVVNFLDISPFISLLSSDTYVEQADLNGDGVISFLDISPFIQAISSNGSTGRSNTANALTSEPQAKSFAPHVSPTVSQIVVSEPKSATSISSAADALIATATSEANNAAVDTDSILVAETQVVAASSIDIYSGPVANDRTNDRFLETRAQGSRVSESEASFLRRRELVRNAENAAVSVESIETSVDVLTGTSFSTPAELFDAHPESLDQVFDSELQETLEGLIG